MLDKIPIDVKILEVNKMIDKNFITFHILQEQLYSEHLRQIKKWGIRDHTPSEWLMFTTEELGELANAISEYEYRNGSINNIITEAIQTATLSLKIAEMYMCLKAKIQGEK